jgi:hypothetical protein
LSAHTHFDLQSLCDLLIFTSIDAADPFLRSKPMRQDISTIAKQELDSALSLGSTAKEATASLMASACVDVGDKFGRSLICVRLFSPAHLADDRSFAASQMGGPAGDRCRGSHNRLSVL